MFCHRSNCTLTNCSISLCFANCFNELRMYLNFFIDSVNILNNGNDVENNSVINQYISDGMNLTLTCTTIDGLGEPSWSMLSKSGNVMCDINNMSLMYNVLILTLSNPIDDFAANFICGSNKNSLYKEVLVTTGLYVYMYMHIRIFM